MNVLLDKYIKDSGYKVGFIASQLGLTYAGFHYKLIAHRFSAAEALKLKELLNISDEDFEEIFS